MIIFQKFEKIITKKKFATKGRLWLHIVQCAMCNHSVPFVAKFLTQSIAKYKVQFSQVHYRQKTTVSFEYRTTG